MKILLTLLIALTFFTFILIIAEQAKPKIVDVDEQLYNWTDLSQSKFISNDDQIFKELIYRDQAKMLLIDSKATQYPQDYVDQFSENIFKQQGICGTPKHPCLRIKPKHATSDKMCLAS